jgi:hypothetical protein
MITRCGCVYTILHRDAVGIDHGTQSKSTDRAAKGRAELFGEACLHLIAEFWACVLNYHWWTSKGSSPQIYASFSWKVD